MIKKVWFFIYILLASIIIRNVQPAQANGDDVSLEAKVISKSKGILSWNPIDNVSEYGICQYDKQGKAYDLVGTVSSEKTKYIVTVPDWGECGYYCVLALNDGQIVCMSNKVEIDRRRMPKPKIKLKKKKTKNGQKYVEVYIKESYGKYAEIYMKTSGKYRRLKAKRRTIQQYKRKYRFIYNTGGRKLWIKVRTKTGSVYSEYSDEKKISL